MDGSEDGSEDGQRMSGTSQYESGEFVSSCHLKILVIRPMAQGVQTRYSMCYNYAKLDLVVLSNAHYAHEM